MAEPNSRKLILRIALILGALALLAVVGLGLMAWRMNYAPSDLDTSTSLSSDQGLFRVSYMPEHEIRANQIDSWTLHVEAADGQPVENAQITVDGDMPQHGHGLPTRPEVTEYLGQGNYRVEGLKFHMPGWWIVEFNITANGESDHVTFNLLLNQ